MSVFHVTDILSVNDWHDLSTPLHRSFAAEPIQMNADLTQVPGMIQDIDDMNGILIQFADYANTGKQCDLVMIFQYCAP